MLRILPLFFLAACGPSFDLVGTWSGPLEGCTPAAADGLGIQAIVTEVSGEAFLSAGPDSEAFDTLFGDADILACDAGSAAIENPGDTLAGTFTTTCGEASHTFALDLIVDDALTADLFADGTVTWTDDAGDVSTCAVSLTR